MLGNDNNHLIIRAADQEIGVLVKTGDIYVPVYVPCVHYRAGNYLLEEDPITHFAKDLPFWYEKAVFHADVQKTRKVSIRNTGREYACTDILEAVWWGERNGYLKPATEEDVYTAGFRTWMASNRSRDIVVAWYEPSPEGDGIIVSHIEISEDQYCSIRGNCSNCDGFDLDDSLPKHLSQLSRNEMLDLITSMAQDHVGVDTVKAAIDKIKKTK